MVDKIDRHHKVAAKAMKQLTIVVNELIQS